MDKFKRLEKILKKKGIRGLLKPARDSDPVDFIILEYPKCLKFSALFKTKDYLELIKRGENIPEELTHYCTLHNKRIRQTIENQLVTYKFVSVMYKNFPRKYPY